VFSIYLHNLKNTDKIQSIEEDLEHKGKYLRDT